MLIDIKQLKFIDENLRNILEMIEDVTGLCFTVTSLYRIDDKGVHGTLPLRGIDLRCRNFNIGKHVESIINAAWIYDPNRTKIKCAVLHGKGANLHLHIQTHPNSVERNLNAKSAQ